MEVLLRKEDAEKIAHRLIRDKYGNIPSSGEPNLDEEKGIWFVPIIANYPRVLVDEIQNQPIKVRFLKLKDLGVIQISASTGEIIEKPRFYDIASVLKSSLDTIRNNVDKALVKVGAENFSRLSFAEHMHTPILAILSQLLTTENFDLEQEIYDEDDKKKYKEYVDILVNCGLARISETGLILPGNELVEIEKIGQEKGKKTHEKLQIALAYFFANEFEKINSIRAVLGPFLVVSGFCYQKAFEYGDVVGFKYETFRSIISDIYRYAPIKYAKVPHYLIQLESVGLIEESKRDGETMWSADKRIFNNLQREEILEPISSMLLG